MAMRDITALMNTYRECSRNLWNVYFAGREDVGHALDTYEPIREMLFDSLVVDELWYEQTAEGSDVAPTPALRVVPEFTPQVLIKSLNAPGEASFWGQERDLYVGSDDISLEFIDYFDFSNISVRDFQYYRCKVLQFSSRPQYEGREALIQASDGRVFHDEGPDDPRHG